MVTQDRVYEGILMQMQTGRNLVSSRAAVRNRNRRTRLHGQRVEVRLLHLAVAVLARVILAFRYAFEPPVHESIR
jgi:hypothetical protein